MTVLGLAPNSGTKSAHLQPKPLPWPRIVLFSPGASNILANEKAGKRRPAIRATSSGERTRHDVSEGRGKVRPADGCERRTTTRPQPRGKRPQGGPRPLLLALKSRKQGPDLTLWDLAQHYLADIGAPEAQVRRWKPVPTRFTTSAPVTERMAQQQDEADQGGPDSRRVCQNGGHNASPARRQPVAKEASELGQRRDPHDGTDCRLCGR